jgi:hypothetical protein
MVYCYQFKEFWDMSKSKNDLNIQFKGKTENLVIKLNGEIIYPFQEVKPVKEINPNKLKTQLKTGVAAVFSGAINRIIPLRETWKRWPVKSRVPYRNILAANIKRCTAEHPTRANMICPDSLLYLPEVKSMIAADGIKIEVSPLSERTDFNENEKMITAAGILCTYSPREKDYESSLIYPLSAVVKNFRPTQNINAAFGFNDEMTENISKYEKCILYFTIVIGKETGMTKRWFRCCVKEFLLQNDAEGKLKGGVNIL